MTLKLPNEYIFLTSYNTSVAYLKKICIFISAHICELYIVNDKENIIKNK